MTRAERIQYQQELKRVMAVLRIPARGNAEQAILDHCTAAIDRFVAKAPAKPANLHELRDLVALGLNARIVRIASEADLARLLKQIPPRIEPVMATIDAELNEDTGGLVIQRTRAKQWERLYLIIINCRGWNAARAFFSEWHELVHLLLCGGQLRLAFRRTPIEKKDPEEVLVDRVAGAVGFYRPILSPAFEKEVAAAGRFTLDGIERIRQEVSPEASRQAMALACLRLCAQPAWLLRAELRLKTSQQQSLAAGQRSLPGQTSEPILRVADCASSPSAPRIYLNMRVPEHSIVMNAFNDPTGSRQQGIENLRLWQTSQSGPIGEMRVHVEAVREGEAVMAMMTGVSDAAQGAGSENPRRSRTASEMPCDR